MKMYEKMDNEQMMNLLVRVTEARSCSDCPIKVGKYEYGELCLNCMTEYLGTSVTIKPRWQTAKTQEDFDKLFEEFDKYCEHTFQCKNCRLNKTPDKGRSDCYHAYMSELVEAPESEVNNG